MTKVAVHLRINQEDYEVFVEPRKLLSDVIREDVGLTGTHVGCEHGVCGACTIWWDGRPARSCLLFAVQAEGHELTTIEAISRDGQLSPLQQAFHEEHGLQCGFCTPGIIMTFESYLKDHPSPSEAEIRDVLSGNLCRCTGYQNIVRAIKKVTGTLTTETQEG
ncbi:MAG TPA: (2Fe-2S)-binding protein [Ktedonobacteraceae bacterium]|nr:(2Fe-2S)-binding protein [Ktedonobacteraceae bacterium]